MAKILIIDDEEVTRDVIQEVLTLWGHEPILEAQDCETGLELFHQASPDLVICDILMPGIGGLETIRRMKEENPASKIMAMTMSIFFQIIQSTIEISMSNFQSSFNFS